MCVGRLSGRLQSLVFQNKALLWSYGVSSAVLHRLEDACSLFVRTLFCSFSFCFAHSLCAHLWLFWAQLTEVGEKLLIAFKTWIIQEEKTDRVQEKNHT